MRAVPPPLRRLLPLLLVVFLSLLATTGAHAQEAEPAEPAPAPAIDRDVSIEILRVRLRPLTKEELEAEAKSWQDALQAQQEQISAERERILGLPEAERSAELAKLQPLLEERTRIFDRLRTVLTEFREKGGDPEPFLAYATQVADIAAAIDITDASGAWTTVAAWMRSPEGGLRWGKNLLQFLFTLLLAWIAAALAARTMRRLLDSKVANFNEMLESFFVTLTRNAVLVVGVIIGLSMLEVEIGPFLAAMGVVGFVLGFALQETLGNFAAGLMILMYQPYDIGDFIKAAGESGSVHKMSLVSTVLTSPDNQLIIIPNGKIWGGTIVNVTGNQTRRVDLTFGIAYGDDMERAKSLLMEVVTAHEKVLEEPATNVRVHQLADSSVNLIARPWVRTEDYWDVYWDLMQAVKQRFDDEGISIPFPQRDVYVHQVPAPADSSDDAT